MKISIGAHTSVQGGLSTSFDRAEDIHATSMQIFVKNNKQWFQEALCKEEIDAFCARKKNSSIQTVVAHACYLINLASSNQLVNKKSYQSLAAELERCCKLEIEYLVLHPGSHTGQGQEAGLNQIVHQLVALYHAYQTYYNKMPYTKLLLETMAGQGTSVASNFEQLSYILNQVEDRLGYQPLGICLDTCHIFAAGYDITTSDGYVRTFKLFDELCGYKNLNVIHVNNSKMMLGSKKDRHEILTAGHIPLDFFKILMRDAQLNHVTYILETPEPERYAEEIALLKSFI